MTVKEFIAQTYIKEADDRHIPRRHLKCFDGFVISLQGGIHSLSRPKKNSRVFEEVEVMIMQGEDNLLEDLRCDQFEEVLGYVPVTLLEQVVKNHGGIISAVESDNISLKQ